MSKREEKHAVSRVVTSVCFKKRVKLSAMSTPVPRPGPHLYPPPTLPELAELHARHAHQLLTEPPRDHLDYDERVTIAEAHAAVARACAHAALANRPHPHTPRVVKL